MAVNNTDATTAAQKKVSKTVKSGHRLKQSAAAAAASANHATNEKSGKDSIVAGKQTTQNNAAANNISIDKAEKAKLAEEIKLNVAAMGMDLLNSSQAAAPNAQVISKVNNLVSVTSPKGLAGKAGADCDGSSAYADDETSPDRIGKHRMSTDQEGGILKAIDGQEKKFSI